jgi:L-fuconolactonase
MSALYNRRRFLAAVGEAAAGVALTGWALAVRAAPGQLATGAGGFALIDTHAHFYDPTRAQGVPWPPREDKLLYRTVLPKDYRALPVPRPVTGAVVVEASPWLEDNQWVLDLAAHELFRGIRLRDRKLEGSLDDPAFVNDLKLLAARNLSLDLVGGMEILPFADRMAKEVPGLRIIIDHLAGVAVDGKAPPADWVQRMRALVRRPNIFCKLSGLVEGTCESQSEPG